MKLTKREKCNYAKCFSVIEHLVNWLTEKEIYEGGFNAKQNTDGSITRCVNVSVTHINIFVFVTFCFQFSMVRFVLILSHYPKCLRE